MRKVAEIRFDSKTYSEVIRLANELAELEERHVHDSAARLFIRAARAKIARLTKR